MYTDDQLRLQHMLDAAKEAQTFIQGRARDDLASNRMLALALVKSIEIIGEAASQISVETRNLYPELPWPNIIGVRNRLVHAYFDIDLDRVWDTITDDLPLLMKTLESRLTGLGSSEVD